MWILLNILVIIYIIKFKPHNKRAVNLRDIFTEINFMIIHILTYSFLDDELDSDDKNYLGWIITVISLLIVL